jgi:hypothetical protein
LLAFEKHNQVSRQGGTVGWLSAVSLLFQELGGRWVVSRLAFLLASPVERGLAQECCFSVMIYLTLLFLSGELPSEQAAFPLQVR